jgi:hypothetical protein
VVGLLLLALAEPDEARGRELADLSGMAFVRYIRLRVREAQRLN